MRTGGESINRSRLTPFTVWGKGGRTGVDTGWSVGLAAFDGRVFFSDSCYFLSQVG